MEGEYSEHYEKINGDQQELDYLVINSMRKIARHAVTVYLDFLCWRALGVGISVRETQPPSRRPLLTDKRSRTQLPLPAKLLFRPTPLQAPGPSSAVSGTTRAAAAKSVFMAASPMG
jgi:hypothetical protein